MEPSSPTEGEMALAQPPKVLVRSVSAATGQAMLLSASENGLPLHSLDPSSADSMNSPATKSDASSDHSSTSYDSAPSITAIERAVVDAPGATTERVAFDSEDALESAPHSSASSASTASTAPGVNPTPVAPRSTPVLERSRTASELLTLRQREFQSARGLNEKAFLVGAASTTSLTAPSFEIESVTLPADKITEVEIDKTMHTMFAVEVRLRGGDLQWVIKKRYSDFRELHDRLKRTNASVKQLHFPKRHVFRNRHQSVIEQRRSELEKYINEALDIRPLIRVPLFNFLEVYTHMESYERKIQRHKKELESERMKNMLEPDILEDLSTAFKRLCSSKYVYHGNATPDRDGPTSSTAGSQNPGPSASGATGGSANSPTSPSQGPKSNGSGSNGSSPSGDKGVTLSNGNAAVPQTAGSQIYISRASFRRDVLGVFPDMPSNFAMRFMKAVSDRQGSDINMDEFLRAVAILKCGTMEDKLRFVFNMCDLDHTGKVQSTGVSNFLISLFGRSVLDQSAYRHIMGEGFDQGRVRMSADDFVAVMLELNVTDLLTGWMGSFVDVLCETPDPHLLESQEEFNPVVQQKILANETHFNGKEVSMLQDAFNNYRASGGGDSVDLDALSGDFQLEMTDERFHRVFASFGSRANGSDIDVFSFVNALSVACRGSQQEKANFAYRLFATVKDGALMNRDDLYGMLRLDLAQNPDLERLVTAHAEKSAKTSAPLKSLSSVESGAQTPSISGSQLGRFVDSILSEYGQLRSVSSDDSTKARTFTAEEFLSWTTKESYEMAALRIMREVVFIDMGLVPASKEEELLVAKGCYRAFDPANLVEDEAWFVVEKKWFDHWCKYINLPGVSSLSQALVGSSTSLSDLSNKIASGTKSTQTGKEAPIVDADGNYVRPKPLNNYPLLTGDRKDRILKPSDEIKEGKHFVVVPEQLWTALKLWYGGGPEIRRKVVIKSDGTTVLDLWEDALKKSGSDDTDDSTSQRSDEEKNKRTQVLALPRRMRSGGSVGLTNLGNTCYMNSALQCLTNTQLLAEYFLSGMYLEDINRTSTLGLQGKLAEVFGKLAEDMWCAKQKAISPRNFKKTIGKFNEAFRGSDQQDSQEMLAFLLSGLSEDLNRIQEKPYVEQPDSDGRFDADLADEWWRNHLRREVSIIVALFTGQYKSLLTCSECGFKSARFEPFTFLQLPLPEPTHNTITLTLVLCNGMAPMKVSVRLGISATVFDLKHELMKLCHNEFDLPDVTEADIKICEYSGSMILSFKADSRRVGQIRSVERLIAFQLETLDAETIQATRTRRPSYIPPMTSLRMDDLENDKQSNTRFLDTLSKGTLVEVKARSQSHEFIPGVVIDCGGEEKDVQQLVTVRLQRGDEEIRVPSTRLRPRQPRLLYIPLLSRKLSYSALYYKNPFRPAPFGLPNLVRLCPERTSGFDLYKLVWQRVKRYVEKSPPQLWTEEIAEEAALSSRIDTVFTGLTSSCGFILRRVESKGLTDSRSTWLSRSFGRVIPCTADALDIMEEETIAIDWDLSIFQDRENLEKMKQVEAHSSVEKNEAIDKGPVPLRHCLDAFTTEEKISEGYCSSCKKHLEMNKKLEIWRLPPVMVIHLKRFQYTQTYRRKLASLVEFPVHGLDLECCVAPHVEIPERYPTKEAVAEKYAEKKGAQAKETSTTAAPAADDGNPQPDNSNPTDDDSKDASSVSNGTPQSSTSAPPTSANSITRVRRGYTNTNLDQARCLETKYDLYGVVNHQGALGGGHYTAYAKNFLDDQWYYYDDERVRVVEESKVVTPSAYLLFYVRSDMKGTLVKDLYPPNSNKKITDEDIDRFVESDDRRCRIM
ncbi:hypothetical protein PINS_up014721 [Pythium insidiosum]|nr:hypothetical protein PINS_up014721 [Pythium insidiosum]